MSYKSYKFHKAIHDALQSGGIQCDFKIANQSNLSDPLFIINCALYQKNKHTVNKYVADFINTLKTYGAHKFKNYIVRIYYDKSATEYIARITKCAKQNGLNLELVEYLFRGFQRDGRHLGHFGALIRYIPLFNSAHNCALNCILDIDTYMSIDILLGKIANLDAKKSDIYGYVLDSIYFDEQRYHCGGASSSTGVPPLLGGCLIIKSSIYPNISVLVSFLKRAKKSASRWSMFKYGVDENFLNCEWLPAAGKCRITYDVYYLQVANLFYNIILVPFDKYNTAQKEFILGEVKTILRAADKTNNVAATGKEMLKDVDKITYYHINTKKNDLFEYLRKYSPVLNSIYTMLYKILKSDLFKKEHISQEYVDSITTHLSRPPVLDWGRTNTPLQKKIIK
jgi:transposase